MGGAATEFSLNGDTITSFNAARGFVGGAASSARSPSMAPLVFQCRTRLCGWCNVPDRRAVRYSLYVSMPHAALWVVQLKISTFTMRSSSVSMPHAALWVVQHDHRRSVLERHDVSMPHAALWGVQQHSGAQGELHQLCFNAARGFVGGAANKNLIKLF